MAEEKKSRHYLSGKEVRAIVRENNKIVRALEKKKRACTGRRLTPWTEHNTKLISRTSPAGDVFVF